MEEEKLVGPRCDLGFFLTASIIRSVTLASRKHCTPQEYLELELSASGKSEYHAGIIYAMAGGTPQHSLICANVLGLLSAALREGPCVPYDSNLRIAASAEGFYTYPDVSIICGPVQTLDQRGDTVTNPTVLFEVLSDSTEAYDRGAKFGFYRKIASLREYVLISQSSPMVEIFLRQDSGVWLMSSFQGPEAVATLVSVPVQMPLAEIYRRAEFPAPEALRNPSP